MSMAKKPILTHPVQATIYHRTKHLVLEYPEWLAILEVCYELHGQSDGSGFAGYRVYKALKSKEAKLPSNLRLGVSYGVLRKMIVPGKSKDKYYLLNDPTKVGLALKELRPKKKHGISVR